MPPFTPADLQRVGAEIQDLCSPSRGVDGVAYSALKARLPDLDGIDAIIEHLETENRVMLQGDVFYAI